MQRRLLWILTTIVAFALLFGFMLLFLDASTAALLRNNRQDAIYRPRERSKTEFKDKSFFSLRNIAIVIMAQDNAEALELVVRQLFLHPSICRYTVIISQEGMHKKVWDLAVSLKEEEFPIEYMRHSREAGGKDISYYESTHYRQVLHKVFDDKRDFTHIIIMEEDTFPSTDFLYMFERLTPILDSDPTVWCISAHNDIGFTHLQLDPTKFIRTGYFPATTWMINRSIWNELEKNFPESAWDSWMLVDGQSKDRDCIVPEVPRSTILALAQLSPLVQDFISRLAFYNESERVDYGDLDYLYADNYYKKFEEEFNETNVTEVGEYLLAKVSSPSNAAGKFRIAYQRETYGDIAKALDIWANPRGWFRDTIKMTFKNGAVLFLADARWSPFLSAEEKMPKPSMTIIAGSEGASCVEVCTNRSLTCHDDWFFFINRCEYLTQYFPCELGCELNNGLDLPNYVSNPFDFNYGKCLVSDEITTCMAHYETTSRLCACGNR